MIVSEENYLQLVIEDVYDILVQPGRKTPWPSSLDTMDKRKMFLQDIIDYFAVREEFEKCIALQDMINELEDHGNQN